MLSRIILPLTFLALAFFAPAGALHANPPVDPTYWQDIRPVFRKNCAFCHAERHVKKLDISGGLALDSFEAIQEGIRARKMLKPGDSAGSHLFTLITTTNAKIRMPLDGDPLPPDQITLIQKWIDSGAKEGDRPLDLPDTVVTSKPAAVRKRDVAFPTTAVPPKDLLGTAAPGPLSLALKVGPLAPVTAVAFSPDGKLLVTGSYGQVTVWDLHKAAPVHIFTNILGAVNDLKFSPDGKLLAVGGGQPSAKGELKLYQVADGKNIATFREHTDVVFSIDFSPDGKTLATGSFDTTIRLWNLTTMQPEKVITAHSDFVYAVGFSPDGKTLASASKDRSVRITDVQTGKSVFTMGSGDQDVMAVAFSRDGEFVVSSGFDTGLFWWKAKTGEQEKVQRGHGIAVQELCFSKDGELLLSASADRTVRLWDGKKTTLIRAIAVGSPVYAAAISPDKKWIATGSFDGLVRVWDAKAGTSLLTLLSLPAQEQSSEWLALTSAGYLSRSPGLAKLGQWPMKNAAVPGELVWQNLQQPGQVVRGLHGASLPAPTFTNKK
jgi:roadblock/LC7 domain-containing protein